MAVRLHVVVWVVWMALAVALGGCAAPQMAPVRGIAEYSNHAGMAPAAKAPSMAAAADVGAVNDAVVLAGERHYALAEAKLAEVLPRLLKTADSDRTAEAMFWLGFCHEKQDRAGLAEEWYGRVVRDYPAARAAEQARARARLLRKSGKGPS